MMELISTSKLTVLPILRRKIPLKGTFEVGPGQYEELNYKLATRLLQCSLDTVKHAILDMLHVSKTL